MDMGKILNLSDKVDSAIVIGIGSDLTLLNIEFKAELPKIKALKIIKLKAASKDQDILSALTAFIEENNIRHNNAILATSFNSLLIKRLRLPAVPPKELLEAIKWQVKDEIPFDLSKAVLDFSIIKKMVKNDGAKVLDITGILMPEEEIRRQVLLLKRAGLSCLAAIPLPFGYAKFIAKYSQSQEDEPKGLLHLSEDNCFLAIYKSRKLEFYRELPVAISRLRESLKGVLMSDRGKLELSADEANEVLFEVGLPTEEIVYKEKISSAQIRSMLSPVLERLGQGIKRSLAYYQSEFGGDKVKAIFIGGGASIIPNIGKFLSKELFLDVQSLSLNDKVKALHNIDSKLLLQNYGYLGLATDFSGNVNLLPREFRTEKIEEVEKISLRWVGFIIFLILSLFYIFARARVTGYQKRLDNALLHLNVISEVRQTKSKIDELNGFIVESRNLSIPVDKVLKTLSFISDRRLFITDFSLDCNSKIGAMVGFVRVREGDPGAILTQFIRKAEDSRYFADVSISSVGKRREPGYDIAEFNITFKVR